MKITFILPGLSTAPAGGPKIVFEYARRLSESGFAEVTICFWCDINAGRMGRLPIPGFCKKAIETVRSSYHPRWFNLGPSIRKKCVFSIDNSSIPDGDWVFATAVNTAEPVCNLNPSKGQKAYLIQDFENWNVSDETVLATYRMKMLNIVVSKWLKDIVNEAAGAPSILIPNPIDTELFFPDPAIRRNPYGVALLYHERKQKGWAYAWEAVRIVRQQFPNLEVHMFGTFSRPDNLPDWVVYTQNANEVQLRNIYNSASVFICASIDEGFGLTCVEAMACGCALVVTDFAGSREYAVNGKNALVSPTRDPEAMAANIVSVLKNDSLRSRLVSEGVSTVRARSWDDAVSALEAALTNRTTSCSSSDEMRES